MSSMYSRIKVYYIEDICDTPLKTYVFVVCLKLLVKLDPSAKLKKVIFHGQGLPILCIPSKEPKLRAVFCSKNRKKIS